MSKKSGNILAMMATFAGLSGVSYGASLCITKDDSIYIETDLGVIIAQKEDIEAPVRPTKKELPDPGKFESAYENKKVIPQILANAYFQNVIKIRKKKGIKLNTGLEDPRTDMYIAPDENNITFYHGNNIEYKFFTHTLSGRAVNLLLGMMEEYEDLELYIIGHTEKYTVFRFGDTALYMKNYDINGTLAYSYEEDNQEQQLAKPA